METSRPLAVVGTTAITDADVTEAILAMGPSGANYNNAQGRAAILDQLIEQALFLTDARKNMMEYDPAFKQQLARVKDDLLVQFAIAKALERVTVSDAEVKKFFEENPDQFNGQSTVSASHILVDSQQKAEEIRKEIEAGGITFEDAARKYSSCPSAPEGGNLGEFGRGQMVPEFEQAAFSMQAGKISQPVKTQFGWHLIRVNGTGKTGPVSFDEAKPAIREHLLNEKRRAAYRSKVNQMKIMYPVSR